PSPHLPQRNSLSPRLFLNPPPTTQIYALSLHDALPISQGLTRRPVSPYRDAGPHLRYNPAIFFSARRLCYVRYCYRQRNAVPGLDRKSTRLNSSHVKISYAVFCLKKKNEADNPKVSVA